ncbi:MAG: SbcC/MukB-like Walker B domain-containing protein [Kineosporiaceae bacterium]
MDAALAELGTDVDAEPGPAPDHEAVIAAQHAAHDAAVADDEAVARVAGAARAVEELARLGREVTAPVRRAGPDLQVFAHLDALTRCADGTGGDNRLRMSLAAFVLAARLEQVAQAATLRLQAMSGGRYGLVHHDGPSGGSRRRAGLTLRVVDTWTGTERETSTLSGGEAFYASLALALGLADVVRAEAGGAVFDTLFIDEGFGSLDADTLEEVLDTIDDLRSGGRVVGIVSHLADLHERIPRRLEVRKGRHGSRLVDAGARSIA